MISSSYTYQNGKQEFLGHRSHPPLFDSQAGIERTHVLTPSRF